MQKESQRLNDKGRAKPSLAKYVPLTLFVTFVCGLLEVCVWEGARDRTELQYIDPHSYGRQRCVFLVLQGCSTGGPDAHSAGWWLSLLHLTSNFSRTQLIGGPEGPFGLLWFSLPHIVYNSNPNCNYNRLTSVLTELYNSSTPTQSLTRSLEWHVWSSSSGNNCHPVHRSLSSGASLRSETFTLSYIISRAHLHDFLS